MTHVPARLSWALDLLDPAPDARLLEIGCGSGVAAGLVCDRLPGGTLTAIDRSATAIARAGARNAHHVEAGRLVLRQVELAAFTAGAASTDGAFAVNVNVFWTSAAERECEVLAGLLRPGGDVHLVFDSGARRDVGPAVAAALRRAGFTTEVRRRDDLLAVTGTR